MKNSIIKSFIIYIIFFIIIFVFYKISKLKEYSLILTLGFVLIFIKDILLYFTDNKKKYNNKFRFKKLYKDLSKGRVGIIDFSLIFNRNIIFPIVLILYMIYLLIMQTKLWGMHDWKIFQFINQNYLLGLTIFSGILTVFKEKIDEKYFSEELEGGLFDKNILLTAFLSVLGTYIIFLQVVKLGFLVYPISIISGILIFLVGISILEDDEEKLETNNK